MTSSDFVVFLQLLAERGMTNTHLGASWDPHKDTVFPRTSSTLYAVHMGFCLGKGIGVVQVSSKST